MSLASAIPDDDNDILNDCLDQIDDYFQGEMKYDEDTIVELLRSNGYNVDEAIDFIMDSGVTVDNMRPKPVAPKIEPKVISLAPKASKASAPKNTLNSVIGMKASMPVKKSVPMVQKTFTIEKDVLPDQKRFDFQTKSPDEYVKEMQDAGKVRGEMMRKKEPSNAFHIEMPEIAESLLEKHKPANTKKSSKSVSPHTPIEEASEPEVVRSPQALVEGKEAITVVIAGHVDHGKSTITGHLMYQLSLVSDKELRKATKEAKDLGKQSFNYAFLMDQNPEEREHGVTIDLGTTSLQTEHRYITLLDAPGHRDFVSAMISGGLQADCGVLVVSAQKGEFEAGMSDAGITKEHLLILMGSGIQNVVVVVNKMDTCEYAESRFTKIVNTLIPYLKHLGFKRKNVEFVPVSGLEGVNLMTVDAQKCPWYRGKSLIDILDTVAIPEPEEALQNTNDVVMMVTDAYHGDYVGDCVAAKILRGFVDLNAAKPMVFLPSKLPVTIRSMLVNNAKTQVATLGNNVVLGVSNADLTTISKGNLIVTATSHVESSNRLVADIFVNEASGRCVMKGLPVLVHIAGSMVSGVIQHVVALIDAEGKVLQKKPKVVKGGQWVSVELALDREVFAAPVKSIPLLGRFIMREEGVTLGIGKVTEVKKSKFHKLLGVCLTCICCVSQ
ncbi:hypothetical protein WA577_007248 [Blastocystis sp. JDR]